MCMMRGGRSELCALSLTELSSIKFYPVPDKHLAKHLRRSWWQGAPHHGRSPGPGPPWLGRLGGRFRLGEGPGRAAAQMDGHHLTSHLDGVSIGVDTALSIEHRSKATCAWG